MKSNVKYLGLNLDQRLTWRTHIKTKRHHLNLKLWGMYWLLDADQSFLLQTNFSYTNACSNLCGRTVYNSRAVQSRPTHKSSKGLQSKILSSINNAPWYVSNFTLHNDLHIPFVTTEISRLSFLYHQRLAGHHNALITALTTPPTIVRRLKRQWPTDLPHATAGDWSRTCITRLRASTECHQWMPSPHMFNF